jgi:hypothetical protein
LLADRLMAPEGGRYSRVTRRMWNDAKFRKLTPSQPCGQTLWFRLLTGPELSCIPGVFAGYEAGFAQALRWPLEGFREAFAEVFALGLAEADWECGLVWVPRAIEHNQPESPNVVRGWRTAWVEMPECPLKDKAAREFKAFAEGLGEGFRKAFAEVFGKASPKGLGLALSLSGSGSGTGTGGDPDPERAPVAKPVPVPRTGPEPPSGNGNGQSRRETANGEPPLIADPSTLVAALTAVAGRVKPDLGMWRAGAWVVKDALEFLEPPGQAPLDAAGLAARSVEIRARAERFFRLRDEKEFSLRSFIRRWNELAPAPPKSTAQAGGYPIL